MKKILLEIFLLLELVLIAFLFRQLNNPGSQHTKALGQEPGIVNIVSTPQPTFTRRPIPKPSSEYEDFLLPDMELIKTEEIYVAYENGSRQLRFDTTFSNVGDGPMELYGTPDAEKGVVVARQRLYKENGDFEEFQFGEFVYHPGHKHWHVNRYALFEVLSIDEEGEPVELLASTDKFSFCIWDEFVYDSSLDGHPSRREYLRCVNERQGNSVGWGDTYTANLEGQEVNIDDLENGVYMIRSTVNADSEIIEKDYTNNVYKTYIRLAEDNVDMIDSLSL